MKRFILALFLASASMPAQLLAEQKGTRLQVLICQAEPSPAVYAFSQSADGELSLVGESDAFVSRGENSVTVVIGDRVFQFSNNQRQMLTNGTLQTTECADVTTLVTDLVDHFTRQDDQRTIEPTVILPAAIEAPEDTSPFLEAQRDAFARSVNRCWNFDPGSIGKLTTVHVAFSLDAEGRIQGDVELLWFEGDEAAAADMAEAVGEYAFQIARRAILRCQSDGYPVPADNSDQLTEVELTFDPVNGIKMGG
jgi:hypothetical protein